MAGGGLLEAAGPCLAVDPSLLEHGRLPLLGPGLGHRAHLPGHGHLPAHSIAGARAVGALELDTNLEFVHSQRRSLLVEGPSWPLHLTLYCQ